MGTQRKAATSRKGSSGSKGNLHLEAANASELPDSHEVKLCWEGSVLSTAAAWDKHGVSGSTSTGTLANLPQCQLRL